VGKRDGPWENKDEPGKTRAAMGESAYSRMELQTFSPPETVPIPSGTILVGGHEFELGAFRIGRTPVTNAQYARYLAAPPGSRPLPVPPPWWGDPAFAASGQPVVGITWEEAAEYCVWLCERTGDFWRLPSELEWERACSGGLIHPRTAWGEEVPEGEVPAGELSGPWETGRGSPNEFGVLDAGTIVHEWCSDWREPATSPRRRASRGGSWRHRVRWSSPSARSSLPPHYRYSDYGFRVVLES
jgi:sulfatase modifying factor 1